MLRFNFCILITPSMKIKIPDDDHPGHEKTGGSRLRVNLLSV